jgi:hypothetical protein
LRRGARGQKKEGPGYRQHFHAYSSCLAIRPDRPLGSAFLRKFLVQGVMFREPARSSAAWAAVDYFVLSMEGPGFSRTRRRSLVFSLRAGFI